MKTSYDCLTVSTLLLSIEVKQSGAPSGGWVQEHFNPSLTCAVTVLPSLFNVKLIFADHKICRSLYFTPIPPLPPLLSSRLCETLKWAFFLLWGHQRHPSNYCRLWFKDAFKATPTPPSPPLLRLFLIYQSFILIRFEASGRQAINSRLMRRQINLRWDPSHRQVGDAFHHNSKIFTLFSPVNFGHFASSEYWVVSSA